MRRTTSAALACATVAGGLFAASPAKADTRSAAQSAVDKIVAGATLTTSDKDALRAQVMSVTGYQTDDIDKAFAAYDAGDPSLIEQLPGSESTEIVATNQAAGADTTAGGPGTPCALVTRGFTVSTKLYGLVFNETLASFSQWVQAQDNCVCLWPPSFQRDWNYNITGNGSFAGWSFDRVTKLSDIAVKYGQCSTPTNGAHDWFTQVQFIQVGKIVGSWNPWIRMRRQADHDFICVNAGYWTYNDPNTFHPLCLIGT
jgi:hypothetical protein